MHKIKKTFNQFLEDRQKVVFLAILIFLAIFSPITLKPTISGDSFLYTEGIDVIKTGVVPAGFVPMKILTTYFGLKLIIFFDYFFNNIQISWLVLDGLLYITSGLFFYSLLNRVFNKPKIAFLGSIIYVTNYAAIAFGLGYLMDIGGWSAYIISLYFSWRYIETSYSEDRWVYYSSIAIGLGGIYKEYSFVAFLVLFILLLIGNYKNYKKLIKKIFFTIVIAFGPFMIMNIYTYFRFNGYTYLDWYLYQNVYQYQNRIVEFVKSFGSIYNFAWFLFLPGFFYFVKRFKENIHDKKLQFIFLVFLSAFCVSLWPVVTRVLFITAPAFVLITMLFVERLKRPIWVTMPILIPYIIVGFLMDSYVLNYVNIDPILKMFGI